MNQNGSSSNRIDPTPVRISTNLTVDRQTPKTDFGDRLSAGVQAVGGVIASGAALAAPLVPGAAILSAAVSSANQLGGSFGQAPQGGVGSTMYNAGAISMGGMPGVGGTVGNVGVGGAGAGAGGAMGPFGGINVPGAGGSIPGVPGAGGGYDNIAAVQQSMAQQQVESQKLLSLQVSMNRENVMFSTVSNVLKTRHDTVKNTIANVR